MGMAADNLVHESETQRQHVRVSLPARARVNNNEYTVTDLSSGGMSLQNADSDFDKGDVATIFLILPFKSFSIDIDLTAEVRHVSAQKNTVGFRFTDLTGEQTSLLNHVLRSFISGEIVSGKDLLAVVSRENFVKVRHHNDVESDKSTFWKRQAIPFLLIGLLGLSALYVIVTNVYNGVFVLQSSQGYVSGNEINVRTPIAGTFSSQLPANAKSVQKGQLIGVVEPYGSVVTSSIQIVSPCDCSIVNQNVGQGEYVTKASPLISLVDKSDTPWVSAVITTQDAQRLLIGDTATILVAGQDIEIKGVIENFAVNDPGGAVVSASDGFDTGVRVRVQPQQKLPIALVGRPARIAFDL